MVDVKQKSKQYFDATAATYDKGHDGRFVHIMYDEVEERILACEPKVLLDLGCGNGNILVEIKDKTNARLYGLDLSENMVVEAKKRLGHRAKIQVGDAEKLPYKDHMFDVVVCNASFHHYPKPFRVLREIRRVLRKGGVLILGDPTLPGTVLLRLNNWLLRYSNSGDYKLYGKKEITELLTRAGFTTSDYKKIDYKTFVVNAQAESL